MLTQTTVPMLRFGVLALAFSVTFASNAFADKITLTGHTDYRDGVGGEFNIRAHDAGGAALLAEALASGYFFAGPSNVAGSANGTMMQASPDTVVGFQTFCLEYNEHISLGGTYDAQIGSAAINGGVGIGGGPTSPRSDPISAGTAYLYSLFATGTLAGYEYANGPTRAADAELLQKTFWYLENERTLAEIGGNNSFLTLAFTALGGEANARADNTLFNVGVLNLSSSSGQHQSQLILRAPDGGVTVILLGLGLGGLAWLRRKAD